MQRLDVMVLTVPVRRGLELFEAGTRVRIIDVLGDREAFDVQLVEPDREDELIFRVGPAQLRSL